MSNKIKLLLLGMLIEFIILMLPLVIFLLITGHLNKLEDKNREKIVHKLKEKHFSNPIFFELNNDKEMYNQSFKNIYLILERVKFKDNFYYPLLQKIKIFLKSERKEIIYSYIFVFVCVMLVISYIACAYLPEQKYIKIILAMFSSGGVLYLIVQHFLDNTIKIFNSFLPRKLAFSYLSEIIKTLNDVENKLYNIDKLTAKKERI